MKKIIFALIPLLVLVACASRGNEAENMSSASSASSTSDWKRYRNITFGYDISYPSQWTIAEVDPIITNDYELTGVSFIQPAEAQTGTTLLNAKLNVARTETCPDQVDPRIGFFDEYPLKKTDWSNAGAGNLYEGETYTIEANNACYVMTFYAHSCNLGSDCGPDKSKAYDKEKLFATFMQMLESFSIHD